LQKRGFFTPPLSFSFFSSFLPWYANGHRLNLFVFIRFPSLFSFPPPFSSFFSRTLRGDPSHHYRRDPYVLFPSIVVPPSFSPFFFFSPFFSLFSSLKETQTPSASHLSGSFTSPPPLFGVVYRLPSTTSQRRKGRGAIFFSSFFFPFFSQF